MDLVVCSSLSIIPRSRPEGKSDSLSMARTFLDAASIQEGKQLALYTKSAPGSIEAGGEASRLRAATARSAQRLAGVWSQMPFAGP